MTHLSRIFRYFTLKTRQIRIVNAAVGYFAACEVRLCFAAECAVQNVQKISDLPSPLLAYGAIEFSICSLVPLRHSPTRMGIHVITCCPRYRAIASKSTMYNPCGLPQRDVITAVSCLLAEELDAPAPPTSCEACQHEQVSA